MNFFHEVNSDALQQRAIALIKPLIPPDAEERVARAIKQLNPVIREHIRTETGLRLSDDKGRGSVPVDIVDGFPSGVAELIDRHRDPLLWRLIMLQPMLGGIIDGLGALIETWDEFEQWPQLPPLARGAGESLVRSQQVAHALQTLVVARKVFDEIKEIREDILGVYRFSGPRSPRIEIYWMAQALFAAAFGLRIEDLTVVTLAHELAHAYTHVGRDIDGTAWGDSGFAESEASVVEGLAQHYAGVVTERLATRAPDAYSAYKTLLRHQSGPYLAHEDWFEESTARRGEIVRFAMLQARNRGKVTDADWRSLMNKTRQDLTKK